MNYYIISEKSNKVIDVLYRPGGEATVAQIKAEALPLANEAGVPVYVVAGEYAGRVEPEIRRKRRGK